MAIILILFGGLLLLYNFGFLSINLGEVIWPVLIMILGLWFLFGAVFGRRGLETETVSIPLDGARSAELRLRYGVGKLELDGSASPEFLLSGEFAGGLDYRARTRAERMTVDMRVAESGWWNLLTPWEWQRGFNWSMSLNDSVPIDLDLEAGASDAELNLEGLQVRQLRLKTGASSIQVRLPARAGRVKAHVEAGAASVTLRVPQGVAGRVRARGGLAEIQVDTSRFARSGEAYQSPDFETAENAVDIDIQAGVGSVRVI